MRRRAFDFVEDAAQMGNDYQAELLGGAGPRAAGLLEGREQAVEGNILAEKKNFVFPLEVVVEVGGREVGGGGDVAHTGFGEGAGVNKIRTRVQTMNSRSAQQREIPKIADRELLSAERGARQCRIESCA